jgi:succinate dehydrogenase/fumarate reductase cytochrome b subunit
VRFRWPALSAAGLLATNLLVLTGLASPVRAAIAIPVAVLLPGALAARLLRVPARRHWDWLLRVVTLSLAGLLLVGLLLGLLPGHRLTTVDTLLGLDLLVGVLGVAVLAGPVTRSAALDHWRSAAIVGRISRPSGMAPVAAVVAGVAAVGLAVLGARDLNRGGGPGLTEVAFCCVVLALLAATRAARDGSGTAAGTALYLLSAAVLLATSLRGTGVTGHDIKIEYRVFTDTLDAGRWHPGGLFAGYRSCLSITVLPCVLHRLSGVSTLDTFRVCFQLLFAVVPVGAFQLARLVVTDGYATLAAGAFVTFPTFVNDMPMLNRQEIAMIFFTGLLLCLVESAGSGRLPVAPYAVLASGLTMSHYTSTYVATGLLAGGWALRQLGRLAARYRPGWVGRLRWDRPIRPLWRDPVRPGPGGAAYLTWLPVAIVASVCVLWTGLTGTAGVVGTAVAQAARTVVGGGTVNSDSAHRALRVVAGAPDPRSQLDAYLSGVRHAVGAPAPAAGCAVRLLPEDELPVTRLGALLGRPGTVNTAWRTGAALLFEGGAVAGVAALWLRRHTGGPVGQLYLVLGTAGLGLLGAMVVAPQLSDDYGLLRLYQQLLVLLAPAVLVTVAVPVSLLSGRAARPATGLAVLGCLVSTSGLVPQLTGAYPPQLNLNDAGPYYRVYYSSPADLAAITWTRGHLDPATHAVADSRDSVNLLSMTRLYPAEGLGPGTAPPDAYLVLRTAGSGGTAGIDADAVAVLGDRVVNYRFPLSCVTAGRPLLHTAGLHRVYGPVAVP